MTDERLTPILSRLDVARTPDPAFASNLLSTLRPMALDAGRRDATLLGRLRTSIKSWTPAVGPSPAVTRLVVLALIAALLLALGVALIGRQADVPFVHYTGSGAYQIAFDGDSASARILEDNVGALSPDGRFALQSYPDNPPIVPPAIVDLTTKKPMPLTAKPAAVSAAAWSIRDMLAWITMSSPTVLDCPTVLRLDAPDGSGGKTWTVPDAVASGSSAGQFLSELSWSPDGSLVAVSTMNMQDGQPGRLYVIDAGTGTARELGDRLGPGPLAWSPDGRRIATTLATGAADGSTDLATIDVETGRPDRLGRGIWDDLAWTRDGRHVLYSGAQADAGDSRDVWISQVRPDGSDRRALGMAPDLTGRLMVSPDGANLAFTVRSPHVPATDGYGGWMTLATMPVDGGDVRRLVDQIWYASEPSWSPDSRWIVVTRAPAGSMNERTAIKNARTLWIVHPDGSSLQQIQGPGVGLGR